MEPAVLHLVRAHERQLPHHLVVLELSSFQLESTSSLDADAASVLNVTEDHLDRYDGMADYAAAKERIFEGHGTQILNRADPRTMAMLRSASDSLP